MIIVISSTSPFEYGGGKKAVKFEGTDQSNNSTIKGTFWGHKLQGEIHPGSRIEITENDAISWKEYKGNNEMSVSFKAQVTILSHGGTAAPAAASHSAPASRAAGPAATGNGAAGEDVMKRAAGLTKSYYDALVTEGFHPADALVICGGGGAASLYPLFWFGEKGMG